MKKKATIDVFFSVAIFAAFVFGIAVPAFGQDEATAAPSVVIFSDDFPYTAGTLLTANGYTAHSGAGTSPITVTAPGLTFSGYSGASTGNAVTLGPTGEDVHRTFAPQASGSVYAALLVNVSAATEAGDYFFHLAPSPIASSFRGRLFVRRNAGNSLSFGISKGTTDATVSYTPFTYSLNTTYLMVIKYTVVAGDTNDTVSLFIDPALTGAEPAPTLSAGDTTSGDIVPGSVALRQGGPLTGPNVRVDGIRIGTAFSDIGGGGGTPVVRDAPADFDGDGRTDYALTRAIGNQTRWFILTQAGTEIVRDWGLQGSDTLTPADFDGDGKDDIAIFRNSGPTIGFAYISSRDGTFRGLQFGIANDIPVVADYDGDGADDEAIFRGGSSGPATFWWSQSRMPVGNGELAVQWGVGTDVSVPGDFTGDGLADFCVQRAVNGRSIYLIHTGPGGPDINPGPDFNIDFGLANDSPVPGDYDGDGTTDIAQTRIEDRPGADQQIVWYFRPSSRVGADPAAIDGYVWGTVAGPSNQPDDLEVPGDYDGDGKIDPAVFRPTIPGFLVLGTRAGPFSGNYGLRTDAPALETRAG